ncbi:ParB/RepB/Spo0J family partition protein [Streptomyces xinghaiensis]|uniref:ParB/RepB/Spo0J family partition protein n=1 Tax=Streptomyces xinghaiensis TaxID=1038928 RepID=UPI0002EDE9FE|nr:ParB N-terminal domain-containing protein [Streptomyces xinghaiensis]
MSAKAQTRPAAKKAGPQAAPEPPAVTAAPAAEPEPQIVQLDPALLDRDESNARETDTEPDPELLASVRELGVQDAVHVRPKPGGRYGVFKGWRRSQAQRAANASAEKDGRPQRTIPAIIREDLVGRNGLTRLLSQIENSHRQGMTARDTARNYEVLLLELDPGEQAKATRALNLPRGALTRARQASQLDDHALRRATAQGMDLEQMADLHEVEDVPRAQDRLEKAKAQDEAEGKGGRGHWNQTMALLRQELADHQARQKAEQALADAKIPLLPPKPTYDWGPKDTSRPLSELTTRLGHPLTEANHSGCPGHSARLDDEHRAVWHCTDPEQHGHKVRPEARAPKNPKSEREKAEAARVREGNKMWRAAREVRKDFITAMARGKAVPDATRRMALHVVMTGPYFYRAWSWKDEKGDVARFLGTKKEALPEAVERTGKPREGNALFALVAAAYEWDLREPKAWVRLNPSQARWLLWLEEQGYTLSEVEQQAVAPHRPPDPEPPVAAGGAGEEGRKAAA